MFAQTLPALYCAHVLGYRRENSCIQLRSETPFVADGAPESWVHIAYEGKFEGYKGPAGAFELTRDSFSEVIRNFDAQKNPIPVRYEHPHSGNGEPIPAAGWIQELSVQGGDLWARVEWTRRAAEMIREGEYRFCSIVINLDSADRKSGKSIGAELLELGLTNTPFLDGMEPIRLSRTNGASMATVSLGVDLDALKKTLDQLDDDASPEKVRKLVDAELSRQEALGDGESEAPEEPAPPVEASNPELADPELAKEPAPEGGPLADLAAALGTDEAGAAEALAANMEAIVALLSGDGGEAPSDELLAMSRDLEGALKASRVKVAELEKRVAASEEKARLADCERRLDRAIQLGQIVDVKRERMLRLAKEAPAIFEEDLKLAAESPEVDTATRYVPDAPETAEASNEVASLSVKQQAHYLTRLGYLQARRVGKTQQERHQIALKYARGIED